MVNKQWEDFFNFRLGPLRMEFGVPQKPFKVKYSQTKESHLIRLQLDPKVKKEDLKVRLLKEGILEIEWPRKEEAEEIEVETD